MDRHPVEKATVTLAALSGNGKLTESQCDKFIELALQPWPPEPPTWWKAWLWPRFLVEHVRFIRRNRWWEKRYGRENNLKNLRVRTTSFPVGPDRIRKITLVSQKRRK